MYHAEYAHTIIVCRNVCSSKFKLSPSLPPLRLIRSKRPNSNVPSDRNNPHGDLQKGYWLEWHPYFIEEAGKFLCLHRILLYLNKHTRRGRTSWMNIYPQPKQGAQKRKRKGESDGYKIHKMSQNFTKSIFNPEPLRTGNVSEQANIC